MKHSKKYIILFFSLVVLLIGCDDKSLSPAGPKDPDFSSTPMENEEAELAALHLSGKLIAPLPLYEQIKEELELIRETWSDSIVHVNLTFVPYWNVSNIRIYVDSSTYDSMNLNQYHHWDSLNDYYRIDTITFWQYSFVDQQWTILHFKGRLNPLRMVDIYAGLPGFSIVTSSITPTIGGKPLLVLLNDGHTIKYFFSYAYGDCPSGCLNSEIYYFTIDKGEPIYHGLWKRTIFEPYPTPPKWADTATEAFKQYIATNYWP